MISGIEGILEGRGADWALVKVGGFTLRLSIPASTVSGLGRVGEKVTLHTHLHLREDLIALYGFATAEELRLFENLLGVTGVGPRTALSLLSALPPDRLLLAISSGDVDALASAPGIGKKTASRLVLELKGKLEKDWTVPAMAADGDSDLASALAALGYASREISKAVSSLPSDKNLTLEEKVRLALQSLESA